MRHKTEYKKLCESSKLFQEKKNKERKDQQNFKRKRRHSNSNTTLNVNGPITSTKRQRFPGSIKAQKPNIWYLQEKYFNIDVGRQTLKVVL